MTRFQLFAVVVALAPLGVCADSLEKEDSTCAQDVAGSCAPPAAASLLQKVFQRDVKQLPQPEDNLYDTVCTGTQAQGRCWFLSEMGDSCDATCKLHGRSFSYTIADPNTPVTPTLVGHEPKVKQEPWAALECYVPSEDRYHTANENAARHYISDVGDWSHETCKLACPCGGAESERCGWKAPSTCSADFMWKGVKYSGCATVDLEHERPWCQHNFQHTDKKSGNYAADWSYCTYSCLPEEPTPPKEENCAWELASTCVKEFDYEATHYVGCTFSDHGSEKGTPWCSNTEKYEGSWNHCMYTCKEKREEPVLPVPSDKPAKDNCGWTPANTCAKEFDYEGAHYVGCTGTDHDTPWCSNTDPYQGSWNHCTYTCKDPEILKPVFPVPDSDEKLCSWQAKPECAKTFEYKGVEYSGCTEQDHPTPWCSLDRIHKGVFEACTRVCSSPNAPVAPVPQPPAPPVPYPVPKTPTSFGDACDRHPDGENDVIGNSVTLDEVGFQIATAADSPVNMKRFVCRVVGSIGCRVIDVSALMGFLPYFDVQSQQTYKHLEAELTTLCHAGGKWVVPRPLP